VDLSEGTHSTIPEKKKAALSTHGSAGWHKKQDNLCCAYRTPAAPTPTPPTLLRPCLIINCLGTWSGPLCKARHRQPQPRTAFICNALKRIAHWKLCRCIVAAVPPLKRALSTWLQLLRHKRAPNSIADSQVNPMPPKYRHPVYLHDQPEPHHHTRAGPVRRPATTITTNPDPTPGVCLHDVSAAILLTGPMFPWPRIQVAQLAADIFAHEPRRRWSRLERPAAKLATRPPACRDWPTRRPRHSTASLIRAAARGTPGSRQRPYLDSVTAAHRPPSKLHEHPEIPVSTPVGGAGGVVGDGITTPQFAGLAFPAERPVSRSSFPKALEAYHSPTTSASRRPGLFGRHSPTRPLGPAHLRTSQNTW